MPLRIAFPGVSACLRISAIAFVVLTRAFAATYYVSPSGNDNHSGLSEAAAVATPQVAVDLANPGDTVLIMDGTYVHTHPWEIIRLRAKHRGSPTQWLTIKAYPGHKPVLKKYRSGAFWNAIDLSDGAAYVELNGLTVEGWNDELTLAEAQADYAQPNPSFVFNANGINVDGRNRPVAERPRHVRIINCTVRGFPAMGIGFAWADYVTAEGNLIENCAWYSRYAASGTGVYQAWNSDSNTADYKIRFVGNRIFNCRSYVDWIAVGAPSDGNGLIIDDTRSTQNNSPLGAYTGRILVANNLVVGNGGSGIHTFLSDNVDIVHNTSYHNSQILDYGEIFANQSGNIRIINNISVARADRAINKRNDQSADAVYLGNLYFGGYPGAAHYLAGNTVAEPGFINPSLDTASANFGLASISPAIDAAFTTVGGVAYPWVALLANDLSGGPRVVGAAPDLGALERSTRPMPASGLVVTYNNEPILDGDLTTTPVNGSAFSGVERNLPQASAPVHLFALQNRDAFPVAVTAASLVGSPAFSFASLPSLPLTLGPGASTRFRLRFNPLAAGPAQATVQLFHSTASTSSPFTFVVDGTGTEQPALGLSTGSLSLRQATNAPAATASLVLSNPGTAPLAWNAELPGAYTVTDSTSPNGPVYQWIDISTTGTPITFSNADNAYSPVINIGFTFPFYDGAFTQLCVNTNGHLSFNLSRANQQSWFRYSSSLSTVSQEIRTNDFSFANSQMLPRSILALWDDLYVRPGVSRVLTRQVDSETFVISWLDVGYSVSVQDIRMNFQVVLKRDGTVLVQYQNVSVPLVNAYVLGIINEVPATRAPGTTNPPAQFVEYANTRNLISPQLAVRYTPPPRAYGPTVNFSPGRPGQWARLTGATSGVLAPGATETLLLEFNPSGLVNGLTYRSHLALVTNDPARGYHAVPVSLTVAASGTATNLSPSVRLAQPDRDLVQLGRGQPLTLVASAADSDGSIASVQFFVNGASVGTDTTAPYELAWTAPTSGAYTLAARATDNLGSASDSLPVVLTVVNLPPEVALTSPAPLAAVPIGQSVTVAATAADADAGSIQRVEFYAAGLLVGTDTTAPYTVSYTASTIGAVTLTARAFDDSNAAATSEPVVLTVTRPDIPAPGLLAHWRLNESTGPIAADSSGNARNATLGAANTSWSPAGGRFGGALAFDGSATAARATFQHPALTAFTVSAWVRPSAVNQQFPRIFSLQGGSNLFLVRNGGSDTTFTGGLGFNDGTGGDWRSSGPGNNLAPDTWHHVVVTFDLTSNATAPVFYINGTLRDTVTGGSHNRNGNTPVVNATTPSTLSFIGNRIDGQRPLTGSLDQVRIYNRVLTAAEIQALYLDDGGPVAPAGFTATADGSAINISWTPLVATNAFVTYQVARGSSASGPFTSLASGLIASAYADATAAPGVTYFYAVNASWAGETGPAAVSPAVTLLSARQAWLQTHFATTTPSGSAAWDADPDGDGVANLLEYALGGDPDSAASAPYHTTHIAADRLTLSFTRIRADLTYEVLAGSDLSTWSVIATNPGTVGQTVQVSDPVPLTGSPRRFLRLCVSISP